MKHACCRFLCCSLLAATLLISTGRSHAQAGERTAQQLLQEIETLRTELVRQHRELSLRNEALRQELARSQQESQALLSQLLEAQTQLGQARSGEELARCRAAQEALRAQLAERQAAIARMEQAHETQLAGTLQENEALLTQLLAAQSQLRKQEPSRTEPATGAVPMPTVAMFRPGQSPAETAQNIRDFFARRGLFPTGGAVLELGAAVLPEVYPAPVQVWFFIETDDLGETWVKCAVKTESGNYLSDIRSAPDYDRVHALLRLIFSPK